MQVLTPFDPSAAASGTFDAIVPGGTGKMVVYNESNIGLALSFTNGHLAYVPAWTAVLYCLSAGSSVVTWTQKNVLSSAGAPISMVVVEIYDNSEHVQGVFPAALMRQTNIGNNINTPTTVPTTLVNDGSAASTVFVESKPAGDAASAVSLTTGGALTLGNATHPGSISTDNANITSDGAGNLTVQELIAAAAGLGLSVAGASNLTGILTAIAANVLGTAGNQQEIKGTLLIDQVATTGPTSPPTGTGTISIYQFNIGPLKIALVFCNGLKNTSASQFSMAMPTAFTTTSMMFATDITNIEFLQGASVRTFRVVTSTAGGAASTTAAETVLFAYNIGGGIDANAMSFDTLRFQASNGVTHTGVLLLVGT